MWKINEFKFREAELDFTSSGQGIRKVTQLFADSTLFANAIECTDWNKYAIQLMVCESCGTVGCESGEWVTLRRAGSWIVWMTAKFEPGYEWTNWSSLLFVAKGGIPVVDREIYDALRKKISELPEVEAITPLAGWEAARICQWEAEAFASVLGRFPEPIKLKRSQIQNLSKGEVGRLVGLLENELKQLSNSASSVVLKPCSPETAVSFYLNSAHFDAWKAILFYLNSVHFDAWKAIRFYLNSLNSALFEAWKAIRFYLFSAHFDAWKAIRSDGQIVSLFLEPGFVIQSIDSKNQVSQAQLGFCKRYTSPRRWPLRTGKDPDESCSEEFMRLCYDLEFVQVQVPSKTSFPIDEKQTAKLLGTKARFKNISAVSKVLLSHKRTWDKTVNFTSRIVYEGSSMNFVTFTIRRDAIHVESDGGGHTRELLDVYEMLLKRFPTLLILDLYSKQLYDTASFAEWWPRQPVI
ncbi:MAG: hypothetical protein ACYTF1_12475 [Planctomycetota bacterium]|jgi:hypothetical protein